MNLNLPPSVYIDGTVNLNLIGHTFQGRDATFRVHYWGGVQNHNPPPSHHHSFFEICYILDGKGTYLESAVEYPLNKNTLFLTRPHVKHQMVDISTLFFIFVAFEIVENESSPAAVEQFHLMKQTKNFFLADASDTPSIRIWEALLLQSQQQQALFQDSMMALSCALLTSFTSVFKDQEAPQKPLKRKKEKLGKELAIYQAKLYICDNLSAHNLMLSDVADFLHMSERHFSRIFKAELGQTFTDYLRKERIRQASILLTTTQKSIKQVAEETGFDTVHYFTRVFSEVMNISPGKFVDKFMKHGI